MTATLGRVTGYTGLPDSFALQLYDAAGQTAEALDGRTFRLALLNGKGDTVASVTADVANDEDGVSTATATLGATAKAALLSGRGAAEDFQLHVYEPAVGTVLTGVYQLRRGPDPDDGDAAADEPGDSTVLKVLGGGRLVVVVQKGARGLSWPQQLRDEGLIAEATAVAAALYVAGFITADLIPFDDSTINLAGIVGQPVTTVQAAIQALYQLVARGGLGDLDFSRPENSGLGPAL